MLHRAPGPSFPHWIEHWASSKPDAIFAQDVAGGGISYGQLLKSAAEWVNAIGALGERRGHVAVMIPTSLTFIEAFHGLARSGAAPIPINTDFKGNLLIHVLESSRAEIMIASERFVPRILEVADQLHHLRKVVVAPDPGFHTSAAPGDLSFTFVTLASFLGGHSNEETKRSKAPALPDISDVAGVIYTSGTTGPSKGVLVPWGQLESSVFTLFPKGALTAADAYYVPLPLFHLSGWYGVLSMAMVGGRVVIRERFKTEAFWSDVETFGCTTVMILGAMKEWLVSAVNSWPQDTPLRQAILIPLTKSARPLSDRLGIRLCTVFGMTETGHPIVSGQFDPEDESACGRVREGFQCRIVDEQDNELPDGMVGELVVRAEHPWRISLGYFAMPEATLQSRRNLWFHTGDLLARRPDGKFIFVDRKKDAIRRRGENISSAEVEAEVLAHPDVRECAAYPVPSEYGEDEVMVAIVLIPGSRLTPVDLIAFLGPRMPRFMLPRYIELLDQLPKTETEKVRKNILRSLGVTSTTWDAGDRRGMPAHKGDVPKVVDQIS